MSVLVFLALGGFFLSKLQRLSIKDLVLSMESLY
jgi:hypothetical protein